MQQPESNQPLKCSLGEWSPNALRLVPRGEVSWTGMRGRSYVATVNGKHLGTIRRAVSQATWLATMPGFQWDVQGDRGSTTTNFFRIKKSPVRGFPSSKAARAAVEEAHKALMES